MYRYGYLREGERYVKRKFVFVCMIVTLTVASLWAGNMPGKAKMPFFRLNAYEISGISVQLTPPGEMWNSLMKKSRLWWRFWAAQQCMRGIPPIAITVARILFFI